MELLLVDKRRESDDVASFLLEARDGGPLPRFQAGQYLPIELEIPGRGEPLVRTYSLSGPPARGPYRITVKRHPRGVASRHLHERLGPDAFITARTPRGEFVLDPTSPRPAVLVSAGVGLTPLVSMFHALAADRRPAWFVHGARDGAHHPLRREVVQLVARHAHLDLHVAYSRPRPLDVAGRDYQSEGRIDARLLEKLVPGLDADFYLCGPPGFMGALQGQLEARGVPAEQVHTESFGPWAS